MTFFEFLFKMSDVHPFITLVAIMGLVSIAHMPFRLMNRVIRHHNIAARGWPPAHCDADGDFKDDE